MQAVFYLISYFANGQFQIKLSNHSKGTSHHHSNRNEPRFNMVSLYEAARERNSSLRVQYIRRWLRDNQHHIQKIIEELEFAWNSICTIEVRGIRDDGNARLGNLKMMLRRADNLVKLLNDASFA
jgi:hypothetical protein